MSRNGPIGYPVRPPARRPLADDPFTAPPTGQPQQPHWPPPQYPEPPAQHGQQPAYGQQPGYPPQQPAYAPQHAQQPAQGYYFPQAGGEQQAPAGYPPQAAGHQLPFGGAAHAPSYAPAPQHAQTVPRRSQQPDPQGYDLGNYMPASAPGFPPAETDPYERGHDPALLQSQQDHDPAVFSRQHDQQGYGETDADFDEMLAEDEEPPRRGRRGLMIAAALVGAIGLGGAMAYTYKTFVASSGGKAPVIKAADFGPNKVKPEAPDGKGFPHTDKKLLNRLGEDGSAPGRAGALPPVAPAEAQDERTSDDPNAPRKVKIIPITPGGPPPVTTASTPPRPSGPPLVAVPGVMLETPGPPPSAARVQLPSQAQPPVKVVQPPPVKIASAAAEPAAPARKAPVAAAVPKNPVPKKIQTAAAPATSGTSGYVAVLSSQKSRMDALKVFADMRQKYGDVLASKTPDVQEADLGEKGVWYRAVVGPPGSRDAASGVCSQLKTAGYNGCWVTAY